MNRVFYALMSVLAFASCASSYNIKGSSNVSTLDGHKLYLKIIADEELKNIDSCDVVHGQFLFAGTVDSTCMANIYMDQVSLLPIVLEKGDIVVHLDNTQQSIGGTPLNDRLNIFMRSFDQLQNESADLVHKHDQAIMDGSDMDMVTRQLIAQDEKITRQMDELLTQFVTDNFDNVLGPGVFMMITSGYEVPVFTPWIEDILSKASDQFKNDPYVKAYCDAAQHNQHVMNGMEDVPSMTAAPGTIAGSPAALPTPNQLAGDSFKIKK
ncbi:MAG: DUF4369 domain-containing protein [Prevotella sp.]|nr:DUF4369 domain-containing protein [Prevotella sp.]